jgi:hypothetical protein
MTDELTQEYLHSVLNYDPKTGDLIWKERKGNARFNSRYPS